MKKLTCMIVVTMLLCSNFVYAGGWFAGASSWAENELNLAYENNLITYDDFSDVWKGYSSNISRQQFAMLAVRLYKALTGKTPVAASPATFTDTSNDDVLRANKVGIINGKGNGLFAPDDKVTRQEMAVMMMRTLDSAGVSYDKGDGVLTFNDKEKVSSWAVTGSDFVFENGFMKGDGVSFNPLSNTTIEQAVIIVNRIYTKYHGSTSLEESDYTKGYTTEITPEGLAVTYKNNGKTEIVVSFLNGSKEKSGGTMTLTGMKSTQTCSSDLSKIYFVDSINRMWYFDFKDGKIFQYNTSYGGALNVNDYEVIDTGKYYGYLAVESVAPVSGAVTRMVFDRDGAYVGDLEYMSDYNYQIEEIYTAQEEEKNKFTMDVTKAVNFDGTIHPSEDDIYFYSNAKHLSFVSNGTGYLRMYPAGTDSAYVGPMGIVGPNSSTIVAYNGYGGLYKTDITFNNEVGNAGIVFNTIRAADGNNIYYGYYVGIDPENDTVLLGKSENKWTSLKKVDLGYDVKKNDTLTLEVTKNGSDIWVYVNGTRYIDTTDTTFSEAGGFGIRTWKTDVSYSNFSVNPLPY